MADVVLDANVLVGLLDDHDVLASRSIAMLAQLRNFNDALLVVLQRADSIGDVASFDQGLDAAPGFRRIS
ncbi:MAG: hypothetical protein WCI05_13365 [Myxococcales bacterium]